MVFGAIIIILAGIIIINQFKRSEKGQIIPGAETSANEQDASYMKNGNTTHIVQKSESLWNISNKYYKTGFNWVDIAKANNIQNPNVIFENQELIIPDIQLKKLSSAQNISQPIKINVSNSNSIKGVKYTVSKGDTLWHISVRAYGDGYEWPKIAEVNKLANPNIIHKGNILSIPR